MANNPIIYETRTLLAAIEQMFPATNFLRDTFFRSAQNAETEHLDVDYRKGKRRMAPFVAPRRGGKLVEREAYQTKTLMFPKVAPERALTLDDIAKRMPGEELFGGMSPEARAVKLLARDLQEMKDMLDRREEWMASRILFEGKLDLEGDGFHVDADYQLTNKQILTGTATWDKTGDPIADMSRWRLEVIHKSGLAPDIVIMASDVADAYAANAKVKDLHDKLHFYPGEYAPSVQSDAVAFVGRVAKTNLEMYTYDEWYMDDATGQDLPFVPAGHILMARRDTPNVRHYGPVTQLEGGSYHTYCAPQVPRVYDNEQANTKIIGLTSRPIFVPFDIDSFYVAKVI